MEVPQVVACPVCTLYLREGMSMHSHLDTHPKDQVIEALVRMYSTDRSIPPPFSQASQLPLGGPFVPVVSEEHIVIGRQQMTSVIHQPLMQYPMYQQQFIPNYSVPDQDKTTILPIETAEHPPQSVMNLSQCDSYQHETVDLSMVPQTDQAPQGSFKSDVYYHMTSVAISPKSPESGHSALSVRSDITQERFQPEYHQQIIPECQDEAARHADESSNKPPEESNNKDDVPLLPDMEREHNLPNLQAFERMPPQGELSTNSMTSDWVDEERVEEENPPGVLEPTPAWKLMAERSYPCMYCHEQFHTIKDRRLHLSTVHITETKKPRTVLSRSCTKCDSTFNSARELRDHTREFHPRHLRVCGVCEQQFPDKESFAEHLKNVHPLECRVCGKTFTTNSGMTLHSKTHLEVKPHRCHICPKSFVTPQKLTEHLNGHVGLAPLQCDMCPSKFRRYSNLKQHKDFCHLKVKKKQKDFFCDCGESFASKKKLARHQETHTTKPKQCSFCTEKFIHNTSLTRHIRRNHDAEYLPKTSSPKARNVQCHICNMTCLETSLASHLRQHSTGKIFSCIICGKKFNTKWNLNLHKWTHASRISKPYKCNLCKGAFVRFGDFQAHIRSHLGHKPFTCNHCGLQFIRKQNWQRHEREHTNMKGYECSVCGKSFFRSYYLTEHLRVHSGVKPYTCHICNKMSATKSNHNKHLRTHHARETINTEG